MFDSWGRYNVHYCGIIANIVGPTGEVESHLMSCYPLTGGKVVSSNDVDNDPSRVVHIRDGEEVIESHRFRAVDYNTSIRQVFDDYDIDIGEWLTHQVSDNAPVMAGVAKLLLVYFVGCKNHLLDLTISGSLPLEIKPDDLERHPNKDHIKTLLSCQKTMKNAKCQDIAGVILRKLTALKPIIAVLNR